MALNSGLAGRVSHLEIEEHCEQAEEHRHGGETEYEEGFPPDSLNHQTLETQNKTISEASPGACGGDGGDQSNYCRKADEI